MNYFLFGTHGQLRGLLIPLLLLFGTHLVAEELQTSPVPDAYVARALFTTNVMDREPVDQVVSVPKDQESIYFFTDLRQLEGRVVTHRWEFEGEFIGLINFRVGGPRWRVFSKRLLQPGVVGKWTVLVLDESGWPLHASIFMQGAPAE